MREKYEYNVECVEEQNAELNTHASVYEEKPKKKHRIGGSIVAVALCCSLIGGAVGAGGVVLSDRLNSDNSQETVSALAPAVNESSASNVLFSSTKSEKTAAEVYAENVNSTVGITTSITTNYWGYQTTSAASGSGFIITDDGYIITNYHVIESANDITVTLYDGTAFAAKLIGYDESNDVAVLKIDAEGLTPVTLGSSDDLKVGDSVVAIGNPLGELTFSLTHGMVSALDREITMSTGVTMNLIQTDCAINSGNSGGALFNMYGEVVGITNAKYSGSGSSSEASIDNIGFAIPIDQVMNIIQSIIDNGYIVKPYIGVSVSDVSAQTQIYGIPQGAAIASVTEGSPAEQAGLQANDIIVAVNGTEISGSSELVSIVGKASVGDNLKLTVYRSGDTIELSVEVGSYTQSALEEESQTESSSQNQQSRVIDPRMFGFGYNY